MATAEKNVATLTPPEEKTPTDLSASGVAAIEKALNRVLADAFALYLKTKNFHWHMSGPNFRDFHLLLDEQASQIYATFDPIAERVRKLGGKTLTSIGKIAELQTIEDNDRRHVTPIEMLKELMEDNKKIVSSMRDAHAICADNDDVGSSSLLETYIDAAERRTWFLFESSRAADSSGH
jgi:starvation-inducible DNA-binding protein